MKILVVVLLFLFVYINCNWEEIVKKTGVCRCLALGGGGDRGAYEVGVINALVDKQSSDKVQWNTITGISAGSLNAGGLSMFKIGDEKAAAKFLKDVWFNVESKDIYKNWFPGSIAQGFFFKSGLFDSSPLWDLMNKLFSHDKIRNSGRHFEAGATSLKTNRYRQFNETDPQVLKGIYASCSVPGVFPIVTIDNEDFVDGGVTYMTPVSSAIQRCKSLGAKEISVDVVLAIGDVNLPGFLDKFKITPFVLFKTALGVVNNFLIGDIQNAKVAFPDVKIRVIKPSKWLPGWFLGFDHTKEMYDIGYADALKAIQQVQF